MFRKEVVLIAITVAFWGYNLLHHAVRIDTVLEKKREETAVVMIYCTDYIV